MLFRRSLVLASDPHRICFLRLVIPVVVLSRWPRERLSRSFFLLLCVRRRLCSSLSWVWWRPGWKTTTGWSSPRKVTPTQLACWGLGLRSTCPFSSVTHLAQRARSTELPFLVTVFSISFPNRASLRTFASKYGPSTHTKFIVFYNLDFVSVSVTQRGI